jgi:hypothetical protein
MKIQDHRNKEWKNYINNPQEHHKRHDVPLENNLKADLQNESKSYT